MRHISSFVFGILLALATGLAPAALRAEGRTIIVLDGSGSMWGQIDGRPKLEIAREALADVLSGIPAATEVGLMAYGHRSKGDCNDIELLVPPAQGTAQAITAAARAMKFLGKTPLTEAVRRAAAELRATEEKATVILITDGIETCAGDPCALGLELEQSGVDFTAHVVGFGLSKEEGRAVACLAENTGGRYIEAANAAQLTEALKATVAPAEPPPPPPPPKPAALEYNIDPAVELAPGQGEPEDSILQDAYFEFHPLDDAGKPGERSETIYGRSKGKLAPGRYLMRTVLHKATAEQEVEISDSELARPVAVLDAGILNLKLLASEGGEPDSDGLFEIRGPGEIYETAWGRLRRVFPAGEYAWNARLGAAKTSGALVIEAGQELEKTLVMGVGVAAVKGFITDTMESQGGDPKITILAAAADLDGNRDEVDFSFATEHAFDLPPGDYIARYAIGAAARAEVPFTVNPGERTEVKVVLNSGRAAVKGYYTGTMAIEGGDPKIEIYWAKADLEGNRTEADWAFSADRGFDLPAGDYVAVLRLDAAVAETPFTVRPGERTEVKVVLNAGVAGFSTPGGEAVLVYGAASDIQGNRQQFVHAWGPEFQRTLPAGDYVAVVEWDGGRTSETPFTVRAGERTELSLKPEP